MKLQPNLNLHLGANEAVVSARIYEAGALVRSKDFPVPIDPPLTFERRLGAAFVDASLHLDRELAILGRAPAAVVFRFPSAC